MKKLFTIAIAIVVMGAFTSCKKCGHCECPNGTVTGSYCGDDADEAEIACDNLNCTWVND